MSDRPSSNSENEISSLIPSPEQEEPRLEKFQIDPKEVISADQILNIIDKMGDEFARTKGTSEASISTTESIAQALVSAAYTSINKTLLATALTILRKRGIEEPSHAQLAYEMSEARIRQEDYLDVIHSASDCIVYSEAATNRERAGLLKFFDIEISLLQSLDSKESEHSYEEIKSATVVLRAIKDYYEKNKDVVHDSDLRDILGVDPVITEPLVEEERPKKQKKGKTGRKNDDLNSMLSADSLYDE